MKKVEALTLKPGQPLRLKRDASNKGIAAVSARWMPKSWAHPGFGDGWVAVDIGMSIHRASGLAALAKQVVVVCDDGKEYPCTQLLKQ